MVDTLQLAAGFFIIGYKGGQAYGISQDPSQEDAGN